MSRVPRVGAVTLGPTNFFVRTDGLNNAAWTLAAATATDNSSDVVAPDGSSAGVTKIVETVANSSHSVQAALLPTAVLAGQTAQVTFYVRGGGALSTTRRCLFLFNDGTGSSFVVFNPRTGLVDVTASPLVRGEIASVPNGWVRCTTYYSNVPSGQELNATTGFFELDNAADGTAAASTVYAGSTTAGLYVAWPTCAFGNQGPVPFYPNTTGAAKAGNARGRIV